MRLPERESKRALGVMVLRITKAPRALLLDAGNTVVFLDVACVAAILEQAGIRAARAGLEAALPAANRGYVQALRAGQSHEQGWGALIQAWLVAAGLDPAQAPHAVRLLRAEHDRFNLWRQVPAAVPPIIARLRAAGLRVGIVSNSEGRLADLLARVGLGSAFDLVVDSALEGVSKPDPEIFWRACARLGVGPSDALYAGDIPEVDVVGARGAGLDAVLVDTLGLYPDFDAAPRFASVQELGLAILASLGAS